MAEKKFSQKKCPHWGHNSQGECSITIKGLYIPLPEHVRNYCQAPHWKQCPQYLRCSEALHNYAPPPKPVPECRRRHQRFSRSHNLSLTSAGSDGLDGVFQEQNARSIELSMGGMRIETAVPLPLDAEIHFVFEKNSSLPDLSGRAEVRWLQGTKAAGTYHCGLIFLDMESSRALEEYLRLS